MFRHFDENENELIKLHKENEILRGYLHGIVDPLDQDHLEVTLTMTLERRDIRSVQVGLFFGACQ